MIKLNSYQIFEVGDIVCLKDNLNFIDYLDMICFDNTCLTQMINLKNYPEDYLNGIYVKILKIIDDSRLLVKVIENENDLFIENRLIINLNYIDKELKRMLLLERNNAKKARRHDNKLKKNNYGKSKFFHKDKY